MLISLPNFSFFSLLFYSTPSGLFAASEITHEHPTLRRLVPYVELGVDDHLLIAYRKGLRAVIQSRPPASSSQDNSPFYSSSDSVLTGTGDSKNQDKGEGEGEGQCKGEESAFVVESTGLEGTIVTERELPAPWQVRGCCITFHCSLCLLLFF